MVTARSRAIARQHVRRDLQIGRRHRRRVSRQFAREEKRVLAWLRGRPDDDAVTVPASLFDPGEWADDVLAPIWFDSFSTVWPETVAEIEGLTEDPKGRVKRRDLESLRELLLRLSGGDGRTARGVATTLKNHSTSITTSSRSQLQRVLNRGHRAGIGNAKQTRTLFRSFKGTRAARIAVQQALTSASVAQHGAAKAASENVPGGVVRDWVTVGDSEVRASHAEAEVTQRGIPLDVPFRVGGGDLAHPRDPGGAPGEVINCRCSEVYRRGPKP